MGELTSHESEQRFLFRFWNHAKEKLAIGKPDKYIEDAIFDSHWPDLYNIT